MKRYKDGKKYRRSGAQQRQLNVIFAHGARGAQGHGRGTEASFKDMIGALARFLHFKQTRPQRAVEG